MPAAAVHSKVGSVLVSSLLFMDGSRGSAPPGKSQVAIYFLRSSGTDPLENKLDHSGPIASQGSPHGPMLN